MPDTTASLGQLRENRNILIEGTSGQLPTAFEIRSVADLGGRFRGEKTFVEDAVKHLPTYYKNVGQHLQAWVPPAPQVKEAPQIKQDREETPSSIVTDSELTLNTGQEPRSPIGVQRDETDDDSA